MRRWWGLSSIPADWGRSVVTIGVFDGVHRGHRHVIERAANRARQVGLPLVVVTFTPNPIEVIRPGSHPGDLTSLEHRLQLLEAAGADAVLVETFTPEFSRLSPEEFVIGYLVERLHAASVIVGTDFRYGYRAAGDLALLAKLGDEHGFEAIGVDLLREGETAYSSTDIRHRIAEGDVSAVADALGRPHRIEGVVVEGARRGRDLGYPTANLESTANAIIPADGIYAGWLVLPTGENPLDRDDRTASAEALPAAISIGTNPTFEGTARQVEAYALDRDDLDLYGTRVYFDFAERLRDTRRFDSVEALVAQMADDVARSREIVGARAITIGD